MAWLTDSLRNAIAAVNPFQANVSALPGVLNFQTAYLAYQTSGLLQKCISIPAQDRIREWRDWQTEKPVIEALEAEERRLGLQAKVQQAEVLRGIGGGALILAAPGLPNTPIGNVPKGGLAAVNVVSRWQLTLVDVDTNMASATYGSPRMFRISGERGKQQDIHPSRVICFRGDPLPAGAGVSDEERFWGGSRLMRVLREVQNSDATQGWFAELVKKAKLLRIGIANLSEMAATEQGAAKLSARVAMIATGESVLNATVFDAGDGKDGSGEKITDYQVTWAGIPAMMDAFDQRVAAVADIPFTRLMGRSPAGMNATGAYDDQNWSKAVAAGQQLETRPCLEQLDQILIRSAGADPAKVTWKWAPLWHPTEAEEATTFKTTMEAVEKVQASGAIPDVAFTKGVQNLLSEREWMPGLDQALAELPEDIRFGVSGEPGDDDPSAIEGGGDPLSRRAPGDPMEAEPRRRAANDKVTTDD